MIDLNFIRENTDEVREALRKLNTEAPIDEILALDEKRRNLLAEVEALRHRRNVVSKEIGRMRDSGKRQALIEEMRGVSERIKVLDSQLKEVEEQLYEAMLQVPNMPHEKVPVGKDESENVVVRQEGEFRQFDFEPLPHWELGPTLGIIDFERGVKISGTRFYVLRGLGAKLERALIAWMIDLHVEKHGYTEIYPPFVVKEECLVGAAQLPKFAENLYRDVEDDLWMIPTAEVPLTNIHRDEILEPGTLPIYYVA